MKKLSLITSLSVILLLGVGCQNLPQKQNSQLPNNNDVPNQEQATQLPNTAEVALYRGSWFDVEYPKNFSPSPVSPTSNIAGNTQVLTDEAYFKSPNNAVEFFVYSPLWAGNPTNYLLIAPNEELVSEKTEEKKEVDNPRQYGDTITYWMTVKAKDDSYYRSLVSIKEQVGTGSELHHVFGIKYQNDVEYQRYVTDYINFKESLNQYSD